MPVSTIWISNNTTMSPITGGGVFGGSCGYGGVASSQHIATTSFGKTIAGDITVEFWAYYLTAVRGSWFSYFGLWNNAVALGGVNGIGYISFMVGATQTICAANGAELFPTGTSTRWTDGLADGWHHVAIVRSGTTWTCYIDGTARLTRTGDSNTNSLIPAAYAISSDSNYNGFQGWIDELRISSMARYTSNFTPPTAKFDLTSDPNSSTVTNLVHFDNPYETFDSTSNFCWFSSGSGAVYSTAQSKFGTGSMSFDGSTGYLVAPVSPATVFTGGPFTIDCWVYPTSANAGYLFTHSYINATITNIPAVLGLGWSGGVAANNLIPYCGSYTSSGSGWHVITGSTAVAQNTWTHLEFDVDASNNMYLFVNGALAASGTFQPAPLNGTEIQYTYIGRRWDSPTGASLFYTGYVDEFCVTVGAVRHTAAFTPNTAAYNLSTDPYASNIITLLHMDENPTYGFSATPPIIDQLGPYGTTSITGLLISPVSALPSSFSISGNTLDLNQVSIPLNRGNALFKPETTDSRTQIQQASDPLSGGGFVSGQCVLQGSPLSDVTVQLFRNADYEPYAQYTTDSDGTFIFNDVQVNAYDGYYSISANPDFASLPQDAQIYSQITETPYAITTTGSFSFVTGSTTVDSTVEIAGNLAPFTVTLESGALPPGASLSVNGRSISITGATSLSDGYVFTLKIAGSLQGYSTTVEYELMDSTTQGLGPIVMYNGSFFDLNLPSLLVVSMELDNFAAPTNFSTSVPGLVSFSSNGSPSLSQTQYKVGNSSLYLSGSGQYLYTNSSINTNPSQVTIEAWIWMTSLKNYNVIVGGHTYNGFQLAVNSSGYFYFYDGTAVFTSATTLAASTWYHIAFTYDGTTRKLWKNGVLDNSQTSTVALGSSTAQQFNIGNDTGSNYFGGYINSVHVWNTCLYTGTFTPSTTAYNPNLICPLYPRYFP